MFPTGLPGLALLLLRASVAIAVVASSYDSQEPPGWLQATAILVAGVLLAGYMTPIVAVVAVAVQAFVWSSLGIDSTAWAAVVALDAIALALVGPGAYSVDAYLFGRRVVVLPPS
jgi:disulfide bond formation protein DsbB